MERLELKDQSTNGILIPSIMPLSLYVQGSKLIHHVTRVEYAKEDRISLILSLAPRNAYHPELTIFHTMKNLDKNSPKGVAEYEYFCQKSWHCRVSHPQKKFIRNRFYVQEILDDYCKTEEFTENKKVYTEKVTSRNSCSMGSLNFLPDLGFLPYQHQCSD